MPASLLLHRLKRLLTLGAAPLLASSLTIGAAHAQAINVALSPTGAPITQCTPVVTVPVTLNRTPTDPIKAVSVTVSLGPALAASGGVAAFADGGFLPNPSFHVINKGSGVYEVDNATLGVSPCGSSGTTGTLFTIAVAASGAGGAASLTITDVKVRDCSNQPMAVTAGGPAALTIVPALSLSATETNVLCFGGATGAIDLTVTGGAAPFTYAWSNGATVQDPSGLVAGNYSVTVTDANGCTASLNNLPVTQPAAALAATATATDVSCNGGNNGAVSLSVSGGTAPYTYVWSNGATTQNLSGLVAATYSVTVTDAHGCTTPAQATVSQPAAISLSATHTDACSNSPDGTITLTVSGGTAPYSFLWSNAATTQNLTGLAAGGYSVTVTDAHGCTAPLSTSVGTRSYTITPSVTGGIGGSISPSSPVSVTCGTDQAFSFTASAGYHIANVLVDGVSQGIVTGYTFTNVGAAHTIEVTFALNPAVGAISNLASSQVRTGNDADGTTKITLTWTVPGGLQAPVSVEVWRAPFGNYPQFGSGATPGSVPTVPVSYPPSGWTLTSVHTSGSTDEPATRDFWYYVAYVTDGYGTRSPVSNLTGGALDYHLGDVSNGVTPGQGDNVVNTADISALGQRYGLGVSVPFDLSFAYLDVGPTTDNAVTSRPVPDQKLDFEDLVIYALNYTPAASAPTRAVANLSAMATDAVGIDAPVHVSAGSSVTVRVLISGSGTIHAASIRLGWNAAIVQPTGYAAGSLMAEQGGIVLSASPGTVDGASLAGASPGIMGEGEFATVTFNVLADGDPGFGIANARARDVLNRAVPLPTLALAVGGASAPGSTALAPAMPNPFSHSTTLTYTLSRRGPVELAVYSIDGRRVRSLAAGDREAGAYTVAWDGRGDDGQSLQPGVFFARLITPQGRFARQITLIR